MSSFIGSIPTIDKEDINLIKCIKRKSSDISIQRKSLKEKIQNITGKDNIFLFNRGREALYIALKALNISQSEEILVQAMTCSAVIAPIYWIGANPIYVDISKDDFNMDLNDLEKKISSKTKAIIVQHTFGKIADIEKICTICRKHNIAIVEDCAHLFRSDIKETKIGKFSDMAVFSFAQDKAVSSVTGGMLIVNNLSYLEKVEDIYHLIRVQTNQEQIYPLNYILLWNFAKKYYFTPLIPFQKRITIGKAAIMLSRWFGITKPQASEKLELKIDISKMSDVQCALLYKQILKLDKLNTHRQKISSIYNEKSNDLLIRYPILVKNPELALNFLSKNKYICGRWYNNIVFPIQDLNSVNYKQGSCPTAEYITKHIINLPLDMNITELDAIKIKTMTSKFL